MSYTQLSDDVLLSDPKEKSHKKLRPTTNGVLIVVTMLFLSLSLFVSLYFVNEPQTITQRAELANQCLEGVVVDAASCPPNHEEVRKIEDTARQEEQTSTETSSGDGQTAQDGQNTTVSVSTKLCCRPIVQPTDPPKVEEPTPEVLPSPEIRPSDPPVCKLPQPRLEFDCPTGCIRQ